MNDKEKIECPGCGLKIPGRGCCPSDRFNASGECLDTYYELTYWTLARHDGGFIHQNAVDAYAAQHAGEKSRPIATAFGLIGLHLALEKGYTGRQVQLAHMKLAAHRKVWPRLEPPAMGAELTILDVLLADTDDEKERMLVQWAGSVWKIWEHQHARIRDMTSKRLFLE